MKKEPTGIKEIIQIRERIGHILEEERGTYRNAFFRNEEKTRKAEDSRP